MAESSSGLLGGIVPKSKIPILESPSVTEAKECERKLLQAQLRRYKKQKRAKFASQNKLPSFGSTTEETTSVDFGPEEDDYEDEYYDEDVPCNCTSCASATTVASSSEYRELGESSRGYYGGGGIDDSLPELGYHPRYSPPFDDGLNSDYNTFTTADDSETTGTGGLLSSASSMMPYSHSKSRQRRTTQSRHTPIEEESSRNASALSSSSSLVTSMMTPIGSTSPMARGSSHIGAASKAISFIDRPTRRQLSDEGSNFNYTNNDVGLPINKKETSSSRGKDRKTRDSRVESWEEEDYEGHNTIPVNPKSKSSTKSETVKKKKASSTTSTKSPVEKASSSPKKSPSKDERVETTFPQGFSNPSIIKEPLPEKGIKVSLPNSPQVKVMESLKVGSSPKSSSTSTPSKKEVVKEKEGTTSKESNGTEKKENKGKDKNNGVASNEDWKLEHMLKLCQMGDWESVEKVLSNNAKCPAKCLENMVDESTGWTPLMYATKSSQTKLAEKMVKLGSDVNHRGKDSQSPALLAASYGTEDVIKLLVDQKADFSVYTEPQKQNALHLCCLRVGEGSVPIAKQLMKIIPPDCRLQPDADGNVPVLLSLQKGNTEVSRELLKAGGTGQIQLHSGPEQDTPLHAIIRSGSIESGKLLVDAGADVDAKNGMGQTPLHLAAQLGRLDFIKFLAECKANPNLKDNEERSPMYLAAMHGKTEGIDLLAEKFNLSVFERMWDGSTLLHVASLNGHEETAMALHQKGVPLKMPNKDGERSIHLAAKEGHKNMVEKLVASGEKVDALTNENYTPLHLAVEGRKAKVVEALLGHGAKVKVQGGEGKETPLHIAARIEEGEECGEMLLRSGAGSNSQMENGETPLHVAARFGRIAITRILLTRGADALQASKGGYTPLHFSVKGGHLPVVRELLKSLRRTMDPGDITNYVNAVSENGETALHFGAELLGGKDIVKLLLEAGGSLSVTTKTEKETPFHYCGRSGDEEVLKEMIAPMEALECQRAVNKRNAKGWTPLHFSCRNGHAEVVETLLENHARVDVFDNEGRSALHHAAENGSLTICSTLLKHKAYINAKSRQGYSPLHYAASNGFSDLCEFLIRDNGAGVNAYCMRKQTPLHLASENGRYNVCRLLIELGAATDTSDDVGQKPIHLAAKNGHAAIVKLFLERNPSLASSATKDGSTCAHLAAISGSLSVLQQLMELDRQGVISAKDRNTYSTPLMLSADHGFDRLVSLLVDEGANPLDENKDGYAPIHLAAKNGHTSIVHVLSGNVVAITLKSRMLGMDAMHIAAFYGKSEMVLELLPYIASNTTSSTPESHAYALIPELGTEDGLTPLHLAAYSGHESTVRLLLNNPGISVDSQTTHLGLNPLHLACRGGHTAVASLLLSRSSELLTCKDSGGKSALHTAAIYGRSSIMQLLLGQGAEPDVVDKELWTPLICAAKAGHLNIVTMLVESGASPLAKTSKGQSPIWFASAEKHLPVLNYLLQREHDTYGLMDDRELVYNLTVCGKGSDNDPIKEFVLCSPAPVDVSAKLSKILRTLATKEKERGKELITAGRHCEGMTGDLLDLAVAVEPPEEILESVDRRGTEMLDVLIETEQKEVISHSMVQRYLYLLWRGSINWPNWKMMLLFTAFVLCPPVWIAFSVPCGHRYHSIPTIKFMSFLTSHIYLMILFCLTSVTPIYPVLPIRSSLVPFWFEWILLLWLIGLIMSEVMNPSDKSGLGWIKVAVLVFSAMGVFLHVVGFFLNSSTYGTLLYLRNQLFAMALLLACVQILDFMSFHHLFGPWAIIIGNLMKDLARFLAVLILFMIGFSLVMSSLNSPIHARRERLPTDKPPYVLLTNGLPSGVLVTPIDAFELLFFGLFGLRHPDELKIEVLGQPEWTLILFKVFFGMYMLVTVVVLINLLIAMMSDTYQRIQQQSDVEWKYGLAKLICSMRRSSATPPPINVFVTIGQSIYKMWKTRGDGKGMGGGSVKNGEGWRSCLPLKRGKDGKFTMDWRSCRFFNCGKPTPKQRWKILFRKAKLASKVMNLGGIPPPQHGGMVASPVAVPSAGLGGIFEASMVGKRSVETVTNWDLISRKYRKMKGEEEPEMQSKMVKPNPGSVTLVEE